MDRLHAFFVALEYLAICEFSVKDGPITYIQELQSFRRKTPDFACVFLADKFFRKKVARLTSGDRCTLMPFSQTLLYALKCWPYWIRANNLARRSQAAGSPPSTPSCEDKCLVAAVHADPPSSKRRRPRSTAAQAKKRRSRYQFLTATRPSLPPIS